MKRLLSVLICGAVFLCGLSGCTPELHERLIVRAVGIDAADGGYLVTVRAAVDSEKEESFTESAVTVSKALESIGRKTGKKPLYSHNALLIFGDRCAVQGVQGALDFFLRHYDSRPTVKVFLAEGTAEEILAVNRAEKTIMLSEQVADLVKAEAYSGTGMDADLVTLINGVYGANRSTVLPVLHKGETIELCGVGVIRNMRLYVRPDTAAMRGYLLLSGNMHAGESIVFNESCGTVSITADKSRCDIRFVGTRENPRFTVKAEIEGDISSISKEDRQIGSDVFSKLEQQFASSALDDITAYLHNVVYPEGCDAAGFGQAVLREKIHVSQWSAEEYATFLQNAAFDICVTAKINRVEEEDKPYF